MLLSVFLFWPDTCVLSRQRDLNLFGGVLVEHVRSDQMCVNFNSAAVVIFKGLGFLHLVFSPGS